jgi:hypothetical protein
MAGELKRLGILYEPDSDEYPNITSSYPAEEIFIHHTWLSEGVYKDIFDAIDYQPRLKINITDCNQSFTPMLTGNINWVASVSDQHFWHLFIRFPKTNRYSNGLKQFIPMMYRGCQKKLKMQSWKMLRIFTIMSMQRGELLFQKIKTEKYITKHPGKPANLPPFNLPYYEGLNRYNDNTGWEFTDVMNYSVLHF